MQNGFKKPTKNVKKLVSYEQTNLLILCIFCHIFIITINQVNYTN